jgi:hypothetical protein
VRARRARAASMRVTARSSSAIASTARQAVGCEAVACPACSLGIAHSQVGDAVAAVDQHHRHIPGHHPRIVIALRPHPRRRPPQPADQPHVIDDLGRQCHPRPVLQPPPIVGDVEPARRFASLHPHGDPLVSGSAVGPATSSQVRGSSHRHHPATRPLA